MTSDFKQFCRLVMEERERMEDQKQRGEGRGVIAAEGRFEVEVRTKRSA
jgi:hypothetical protein